MYYRCVFRLSKPETPGQWIGHIILAVVALHLVSQGRLLAAGLQCSEMPVIRQNRLLA
jgi:hypothetical protein